MKKQYPYKPKQCYKCGCSYKFLDEDSNITCTQCGQKFVKAKWWEVLRAKRGEEMKILNIREKLEKISND